MCIIVFSQLNMKLLLHKAGLPGHPKALLALLDTYQSSVISWCIGRKLASASS
jgi:hypothetical protein